MKKIDIVDIKNKVNDNELNFKLKDGYIYCEDKRTQESVIVGNYAEINLKPEGIIITIDGKPQPVGVYIQEYIDKIDTTRCDRNYLSIREMKLLSEMKENCLKKGKYNDPQAKPKYNLLCRLEEKLATANHEVERYRKDKKTLCFYLMRECNLTWEQVSEILSTYKISPEEE